MRIVQINHFSYKAAGGIMMNIHQSLLKEGEDSYVVWGRGKKAEDVREYYMADDIGVRLHALYTRMTDRTGFASKGATKKLVKWLEGINPDIIHLHCIHGYYINLEVLFNYIRKNHIKVVWTQHDCWSFTGHCAYFDAVGCTKWKTGCYECQQLSTYPKSYIDNSKKNWKDKKELFGGLDMVCVTPCEWLKKVVGQSFLAEYPCYVIYNGIDTNVFHYIPSNFKKKNGLENYCIILGVASEWTERKGLKDFIRLDSMIDHNRYKIVIIGLTKKQIENVPKTIFAMERTSNAKELAEIYSVSDVYLNLTYEDNFPTTNLEAIACGTKVITYKTGGSPEAVKNCYGYVVEKGDLESVWKLLPLVCRESKRHSIEVAYKEKADWLFSSEKMSSEYLLLYKKLEGLVDACT